jgi:hypothetical protein
MSKEIQSAAHKYLDMGLSVMPVRRQDKRPCLNSWRKYQVSPPTHEEIDTWWKEFPDANVAIITGSVSGLVVVDVDTKEKEAFTAPVGCAIAKTSKGFHYFLRGSHGEVKNSVGIIDRVDIRGEGGYVVAAPSIHASGEAYVWIEFCSLEEMGLENLPVYEEARVFPMLSLRKNSAPTTSALSFDKIFSLVHEGSRNNTLARSAGLFYRHTNEALWPMANQVFLELWNRQYARPPLEENEVRATLRSIEQAERQRRAISSEEEVVALGPATPWGALLHKTFPGVAWTVQGLFESGTINMISAAPNQYKSWLLLHIAARVASGGLVFNKFSTSQSNVLIVNEEDTERSLQERIRKIATDENLNVSFYTQKGIKVNETMIEALLLRAREDNIGVIMFDSFRTIHDADENQSGEIQKIMNELKKLTREGITILMTHHHRKGMAGSSRNRSQTMDDARGSTAISAALHGHISCEEKEIDGVKRIVIHQHKLKADEKMPSFQIECPQKEGAEAIYGFGWKGDYKPRQETSEETLAQVLAFFEGKPAEKWSGISEVKGELGTDFPDKLLRKCLSELTEGGELEQADRKNRPELYVDKKVKHNASLYRLAQ